jgi:hypothetical protein
LSPDFTGVHTGSISLTNLFVRYQDVDGPASLICMVCRCRVWNHHLARSRSG